MTEQERTKQIEQLNKTPLSKALQQQVKKSYLMEHELILIAVLAEFLDEMILREPEGLWKTQLQNAREVMESLESWQHRKRYSPKALYEFLTTTEEADDWTEESLLNLVQSKDPEEWILGTVGQEMTDNLSVWFNLNQ